MVALTHEEQTQVPGPKRMSSYIMHEEQGHACSDPRGTDSWCQGLSV